MINTIISTIKMQNEIRQDDSYSNDAFLKTIRNKSSKAKISS